MLGELTGRHEHERGRMPGRAFWRRWSIGRPKASVLPDPVWALPHTSRPASASSMVACWMGNGSLMPWAARASTNSATRPRSANVFTLRFLSHVRMWIGPVLGGSTRRLGTGGSGERGREPGEFPCSTRSGYTTTGERGMHRLCQPSRAPSAGFEPAHTAPEADALSPELRGQGGRAYQRRGSEDAARAAVQRVERRAGRGVDRARAGGQAVCIGRTSSLLASATATTTRSSPVCCRSRGPTSRAGRIGAPSSRTASMRRFDRADEPVARRRRDRSCAAVEDEVHLELVGVGEREHREEPRPVRLARRLGVASLRRSLERPSRHRLRSRRRSRRRA